MLTQDLQNQVQKLWDKLWSGGIANPLQAIEQITYLLFMKQLDELDMKRTKAAKFTGDKYESLFVGNYKSPGLKDDDEGIPKEQLRWSSFKRLPGDDMLNQMRTQVFPFVQSLGGEQSHFTRHMSNAVFIIPKGSLLVEAVKIIDEIYGKLKEENRFIDAQGDFYEHLLKQLSGAGKNGQFRTPTHLIEMVVELVEPKLGQRIADPACGTAGFLLAAYKFVITQFSTEKAVDDSGFMRGSSGDKLSNEKLRKKLNEDTFFGFDIDGTMIRIALMNLMMHGIGKPQVDYMDTLSKRYNEEGVYDVILANPPFTGSIDDEDVNTNFELKTRKTELLFLERMYKMLRIGGTAGVIVPQGVLFGSSKVHQQTRSMLLDRCELKAVISMPSGFFKPYTGVATAVLVFVKGGETENVWFYNMESDGYSLDDKRTPLLDKKKERDFGDLHTVIAEFRKKKKNTDRKQQHFLVPKQEIVENGLDLSFNRYQEIVYDEIPTRDPSEIMDELSDLENEIQEKIEELKSLLR